MDVEEEEPVVVRVTAEGFETDNVAAEISSQPNPPEVKVTGSVSVPCSFSDEAPSLDPSASLAVLTFLGTLALVPPSGGLFAAVVGVLRPLLRLRSRAGAWV
jgi:hypothetical protein